MKKLLILPLLLLTLTVGARVWYVDESGNDGTGDGSSGNPWALVSYACTQASSGDTIFVNAGTINESAQIVVPVGVSLMGEGATSIISTTYAGTYLSAAIALHSNTGNPVDGAQTISYLKFDGNSLTSNAAITVRFRSNVKIHHCTFIDFDDSAVNFINQDQGTWTNEPTITFATGNEVHNCTINNCSGTANYAMVGSLTFLGQNGMLIHDNEFPQTARAAGLNGTGIKSFFHKKCKVYNNTFYKLDHELNKWNFFVEFWNYTGDFEYTDNIHYGLAKVDFAGNINRQDEDCTFGLLASRNKFYNNSVGNRTVGGYDASLYAICLEGDGHINTTITRNYIQNYGIGIEVATPTSGSGFWATNYWDWTNIEISANIIHGVGYLDHAYSYGIWWINESNNYPYYGVFNNVSIINNTITGDNSGSYPGYQGIGIYANDTINDLRASNNIITGFSNYGIYFSEHSTDTLVVDGVDVTYNCMNDNGTNTVYVESGARITITDSDVTTGNITTAPAFKSESTFRLTPTSPCIDAGIDVGLDYDYYGHKITGTPDIGAMEYGRYTMKTANKTYR